MAVGVKAVATKSGEKKITLFQFSEKAGELFMVTVRRHCTESRNVADWQAAWYASVEDAASGLMTDFGIDWFNRARAQLAGIRAA